MRQNRELQIMKMLDHGNVTTLHHYFYTEGEKPDEMPLEKVDAEHRKVERKGWRPSMDTDTKL